MLRIYIYFFLNLIMLFFSACEGGSSTQKTKTSSLQLSSLPDTPIQAEVNSSSTNTVSISGIIGFEKPTIQFNGDASHLDFSHLEYEKSKHINVRLINNKGEAIASTFTNSEGEYRFSNLLKNREYKVRVYAKMLKEKGWDVKVIDNTNGGAVYVIEGEMVSTGTSNSIRNLTASAINQSSPPFAILNSIDKAMNKVRFADSHVVFPPLKINWSVNNIETGTYYDGVDNIIISGDQQGDSDEYDHHIIIHEWGHYFENKFSRADNIGGQHGSDEYLDIRVAFGEGFGNAFSAIVTDDPIYFDTLGNSGWYMNIESEKTKNAGWFSETSIQQILYDLYDSDNDGEDNLALGFQPLYDIFVHAQKNTPAFTSIFTFIHALKKANPIDTIEIDNILLSQKIAPIKDIYGKDRKGEVNALALPLYRNIDIGGKINICTSNTYGTGRFPRNNKLNHHKYVTFKLDTANQYTIKLQQSNGRNADPDFILFQTSPFKSVAISEEEGSEVKSIQLEEGDYLLDISDANNVSYGCFNLSIN